MIEKHQFIPMEQDKTCCAYFGCALGESNDVHDVPESVNAETDTSLSASRIMKDSSLNADVRTMVALEGQLELTRVTHDDFVCSHQYLTGIAVREDGAANIANVERFLELLNGKYVRVIIEHSDKPLPNPSTQATASPKAGSPTPLPDQGSLRPSPGSVSESVSSDTPASPSQPDSKYEPEARELLAGYGFSSAPGLAVTDNLAIAIASLARKADSSSAQRIKELEAGEEALAYGIVKELARAAAEKIVTFILEDYTDSDEIKNRGQLVDYVTTIITAAAPSQHAELGNQEEES